MENVDERIVKVVHIHTWGSGRKVRYILNKLEEDWGGCLLEEQKWGHEIGRQIGSCVHRVGELTYFYLKQFQVTRRSCMWVIK